MPCTYSVVDLREIEREKQADLEKWRQEKKAKIARKKKALILALSVLGFDVSLKSLGGDQTFILGAKE